MIDNYFNKSESNAKKIENSTKFYIFIKYFKIFVVKFVFALYNCAGRNYVYY